MPFNLGTDINGAVAYAPSFTTSKSVSLTMSVQSDITLPEGKKILILQPQNGVSIYASDDEDIVAADASGSSGTQFLITGAIAITTSSTTLKLKCDVAAEVNIAYWNI